MTVQMLSIIGAVFAVAVGSISPALAEGRAIADALLVTTAHPLGEQEQAQWRAQLARRLGADFGVKFSADPALIAGAVITFPHAILRFNWRDSLAAALKELHSNGPSR